MSMQKLEGMWILPSIATPGTFKVPGVFNFNY